MYRYFKTEVPPNHPFDFSEFHGFSWICHEIAPRSQAIVSTAAWQWIILDGQKVSKRHVSGGHVVHVDVQIDMLFFGWLRQHDLVRFDC